MKTTTVAAEPSSAATGPAATVPSATAPDAVVPFSWVPAIRWASLVLGFGVAVARGPAFGHVTAWGLVLAVWSTWTALGPQLYRRSRPSSPTTGLVVIDVAINLAAVVTTGYWNSPYVFCLVAAVMAVAATRGFGSGFKATLLVIPAIAIPYQIHGGGYYADRLQTSGQWSVELLLVVLLAGYAQFLFGQAQARHSVALDRMSQLAEANDLLVSLHRVAQTLPASLNLEQVLTSTLTRLRSMIDYDVGALLLRDDASSRWVIRAGDGVAGGRSFGDDELPPSLRAATGSSVASAVVCLDPGDGLGSEETAGSGLYAPLRSRGALIGLLAIEHRDAGRYGRRELQLLDGFIDLVALAIDNARWFARLRTMGADEERIRIARDIHDSVGQSLAYVAFRLDAACKLAEDEVLRDELDVLRGEVRGVLTEVRDALCDLRTDVSEERGLIVTIEAFLDRLRSRTDMVVTFDYEAPERLPVLQERELWRIAQEAVTNAEHHARATHLRVRWECDGRGGRLTVADDGEGFSVGNAGRADSYGIAGMKERADAIGAKLEIESERYVGTVVECILDP